MTITPDTAVALWGGERLDIGLAVDAMLGLDLRRESAG
jgi:hypothetical protein